MRMKTIGIVSALVAFACGDLGADETSAPDRTSARPELVIERRLREPAAVRVVVISGDRHLAELSALPPADGIPYPLYDLTTSGLNQAREPDPKAVPKKPQPNRHRLHERPYTGSNFGLMRVNWDGPNPSLRLEVCGITGEVVLSRDLPFSGIQPN
jgi:alkaline phosphatase D